MPAFDVRATVSSSQPDVVRASVERGLRYLHPQVAPADDTALEVQLTVIAADAEAADDFARARLLRIAKDELSVRVDGSDVSPRW